MNRFATQHLPSRERIPLAFLFLVLSLQPPTLARCQITMVNVGATNDGGYASAITVVGDYAYLANAAEGLRIYDISNPAHPTRVAQATNSGLAFGLTVRSNLLYLACDHEGLHIYDISNPTSPVHLAQATNDDLNPHSTAVAVSGNDAFLADANSGLWACD